jgi:hypothetical protein
VFVLITASVLAGEFLPTRRKSILLSGLGLSMFTFAIIAWGENITSQFSTVALQQATLRLQGRKPTARSANHAATNRSARKDPQEPPPFRAATTRWPVLLRGSLDVLRSCPPSGA